LLDRDHLSSVKRTTAHQLRPAAIPPAYRQIRGLSSVSKSRIFLRDTPRPYRAALAPPPTNTRISHKRKPISQPPPQRRSMRNLRASRD
jgi:hypothetical protein